MGIFKGKETKESGTPTGNSLESQLAEQAKKIGLSVDELKALGQGKSCPKYGTAELLHARRTRNGKITVFNISEKFRGEKISIGRKLLKEKKVNAQAEKKVEAVAAPIDGTKPQ